MGYDDGNNIFYDRTGRSHRRGFSKKKPPEDELRIVPLPLPKETTVKATPIPRYNGTSKVMQLSADAAPKPPESEPTPKTYDTSIGGWTSPVLSRPSPLRGKGVSATALTDEGRGNAADVDTSQSKRRADITFSPSNAPTGKRSGQQSTYKSDYFVDSDSGFTGGGRSFSDPAPKPMEREIRMAIPKIKEAEAQTLLPTYGFTEDKNAPKYGEREESPSYTKTEIAESIAYTDAYLGAKAKEALGQYGKGNIDLQTYPRYTFSDGSVSTVDTLKYREGDKIVLLPTLVEQNGTVRKLTDDEAYRYYLVTGKYLGKFDTEADADAYTQELHAAQNFRDGKTGVWVSPSLQPSVQAAQDAVAEAEKAVSATKAEYEKQERIVAGIRRGGVETEAAVRKLEDDRAAYQTALQNYNDAWRYWQATYSDTMPDYIKNAAVLAAVPRPEVYTEENILQYRDRAAALAVVPEWTDEQRAEATEIYDLLKSCRRPMSPNAIWQPVQHGYVSKDFGNVYTILEARLDMPVLRAFGYHLGNGIGATPIMEAASNWLLPEEEASQIMERDRQLLGITQQEHPIASVGGEITGNVALASGLSAGFSALGAPAAATNALTYMAMDGIHNLGDVSSGKMAAQDYFLSMGKAGLSSVASSVAQEITNLGVSKVLQKYNLMTPLGEFTRIVASSTAKAGAYTAVDTMMSKDRPSTQEQAVTFISVFAFTALSQTVESLKTTATQRTQMQQSVSALQTEYDHLQENWATMTPWERERAAEDIKRTTNSLQRELANGYFGGQQTEVNQARGTLELIDTLADDLVRGLPDGTAQPDEVLTQTITDGLTAGLENASEVGYTGFEDNDHIFSPDTNGGKTLIAEVSNKGYKISPEKVIGITRDSAGKIIWLESGDTNAGLTHTIERHMAQFESSGISKEELPAYLLEASSRGTPVGLQGKRNPRVVYEVFYNGEKHWVAVQVSSNGYIVGANPKSVKEFGDD
ncbi:MAG: hypothetical protein IJT07_00280 [Oscillospiraceae bacterium]|nr:hypothetical protein [Oscillospiraceae bacterium]